MGETSRIPKGTPQSCLRNVRKPSTISLGTRPKYYGVKNVKQKETNRLDNVSSFNMNPGIPPEPEWNHFNTTNINLIFS